MTHPNDECPNPDDPEYVEVWQDYMAIKKANERKEHMLREQYGPNARLDDSSATQARIELILTHLMPPDTIPRILLEIEWQGLVANSLEVLHNHIIQTLKHQEAEMRKQKLIVPGTGIL